MNLFRGDIMYYTESVREATKWICGCQLNQNLQTAKLHDKPINLFQVNFIW